MATDADFLSSVKCAICFDLLTRPKFIGPCTHTFCKACIDQLWVSLERRRTVPCPQCREECQIPSDGVGGLKDNFMVASIIDEAYHNQQQRAANLTEIKRTCTLCPNRASCFCKDCDLKLCPDCRRRHDSDPNKHDHDLFGLCPSHCSGLLFFCDPCKQAVCSGCRISDHEQDGHHVIPIRPVVDELMSDIQTSSAELENAIRTQVGEQEMTLSQLRDIVEQKSTPAEVEETTKVERNIDDRRNEIAGLRAESQNIQKQIDILVTKKAEVDDKTKQLVQDVDKIEKDKLKIIADVRERYTKSTEEINLRLQSLETHRKDMTTKLEQGREVGSAKIIIDTESIANLTSIRQKLMDLVNAARENDTWTVLDEVTSSISELGLAIGNMGHGLAVMSGDHQTRGGQTKRVFRQLKKVCNVTFSRKRPCRTVYRSKHLHVTAGSLLATLGKSQGVWADTIYLHDDVSSSLTGKITKGVHPARDIAVLSTGEVVVARREKPPIIVFNPVTGASREINITHDRKPIDTLWSVETDESDNMFVLTGYSDPHLLVVEPNGNVIQSVKLSGYAYNLAFCLLNRILYIAANDRILRFHWNNDILKEITSSSHGVDGFRCDDVCTGSGGEVLVAGLIENEGIVIYQVVEAGDNLVWGKIEYQDDEQKKSDKKLHICINDDYLWLGYGDTIEKFQLVHTHESNASESMRKSTTNIKRDTCTTA